MTSPSTAPARSDFDGELRPLAILAALLGQWRILVGFPIVGAVLAIVLTQIMPKQYESITTFVPEGPSSPSGAGGLAALAGQFGVNLGQSGAASPEFFVRVLTSRTLTDQIVLTEFPDPRDESGTARATLLDIMEIEADTEQGRIEAGRKELDGARSVNNDLATGIVTVRVTTRYPALSAAVANRHLEILTSFNVEARQTNAQERRRFVEERLTTAQRELGEAESELERFLDRNATWEQSPRLRFTHDRLQRRVSVKQEVVLTLTREFEEARIEEVNDTPVLTVIDQAVVPSKKSSPSLAVWGILMVALFGGMGLALAAVREYGARASQEDNPDYRLLMDRWSTFKRDVLRLGRRTT